MKSRLVHIIVTLLFFQFSFSSNWYLRKISNESGLSNSAITKIYKDKNDFIWFGSWDGLNLYDGENIHVFKPRMNDSNSISNNVIRDITEDKYNNLWIVTENGINQYNRFQKNFTQYLLDDFKEPYVENKIKIALSNQNELWCLKYNKGIYKYNQVNKTFIKQTISNNNNYIFFNINKNNELITISDNGILYKYKKFHNWELLKKIDLNKYKNIDFLKSWYFRLKDQDYLFVKRKNKGIQIINLNNEQTSNINFNYIPTCIKRIKNLNFRIGTEQNGIIDCELNEDFQVTNKFNNFESLSKLNVKIWDIYESNQTVWVGTDGIGVFQYIENNNRFYNYSKDKKILNHNIVRGIVKDKNQNTWVGTRGGGINVINTNNKLNRIYNTNNGLTSNLILSLFKDREENIWVGIDDEGIEMYSSKQQKFFHFPKDFVNTPKIKFGNVYAICEDVYGDIWLGTSGYGLVRLKIKEQNNNYFLAKHRLYNKESVSENKLYSNVVYSIIEEKPNIIWIGTRGGGGLYRMNTFNNKFEIYRKGPKKNNSIISNDVLSLFKTADDILWVGTSDGLNRINLKTKPYNYLAINEKNGLSNNTIHSILEDANKNIWVSTNNGLSKIDNRGNNARKFFKPDGLVNFEYTDGANWYDSENNLIYFGGINGVDYFNPSHINDSKLFPKLSITNFSISNQTEKINKEYIKAYKNFNKLELEYDQNFFEFQFTSLDYKNKNKCKYAYKLEGFDNNFNYTEVGEAKFTNVPPGNYNLIIKNSNEDGIWNDSSEIVHIKIHPPFWKTSLAYLIYALIFLFLMLATIYKLVKRVKVKHEKKLVLLEQIKSDEINQYKLQFFTNIAHEFRTPLTLIMAPASQLLRLTKNNKDLKPYVQYIHNNSIKLQQLIKELIEFRKIETGYMKLKTEFTDINLLIEMIVSSFDYYAKKNHIKLDYVNSNKQTVGYFDLKIIEKILTNIISNAIKYTPEHGQVSIAVTTKHNNLNVQVSDTGIGISNETKTKVFQRFFNHKESSLNYNRIEESSGIGLSLTKSLAQLHKGEIIIESTMGEGSTFEFIVPFNKESYSPNEISNSKNRNSLLYEKIYKEFAGSEPISINDEEKIAESDKTILIVDDNQQVVDFVKNILYADYNIETANNGKEALNIINLKNINLVISDIIMPIMDGLELCKKLKEDIDTSHIPIILLTAKAELENRIEGIEFGADSYIPKPFDPKHLQTRIAKLLENRTKIAKSLQGTSDINTDKLKHLGTRDTKLINSIKNYIIENIDNPELDSEQIATHFALSKTQVYRKIKGITNMAPHAYIKHLRLILAEKLLKENNLNVSEIIAEIGFNNRTYFYKSFKEKFHCSPKEFVTLNR
jgi:signal transduction histidine kinase/ligand-binding sensor domain-containing protein/CheY-like chemotaxis protein/AraC-like DNA-binding protein